MKGSMTKQEADKIKIDDLVNYLPSIHNDACRDLPVLAIATESDDPLDKVPLFNLETFGWVTYLLLEKA